MAPVFQAVGAQIASTGATVSVVWPTHLANDIGLVVIETSGNSANLTPPAGWAAIPGTPVTDVATIAGSKLHVWWKRAASSAEAAVATGAGTDHVLARLYTFRGCVTTGNPWNVTTTGTKTTASTTATVPALVTTVDDTLITMIVGRPNDNASTVHFAVPVNANLTGLGEAGEAGTASGNGGGFVVSYGIEATASNTGTSTLAKIASTTDTYVVLALKAPLELIVNPGTFTLSGTDIGLLETAAIIGTTGTFSLVGNDVDFSKSVSLDTSVGTFTLAGTNTELVKNNRIDTTVGTFTLAGTNTDLSKTVYLNTSVGKFFLPERNLRPWSESFEQATWTTNAASINANATTAPDGTLTADALIENTTQSVSHTVGRSFTYVTGKTYTTSCYFKLYPGPITRYARLQLGNATVFPIDTYININLATGTIFSTVGSPSDSGITNVGNGWYRAWITKQYIGAGVTFGPVIQIVSTGGVGLYTDADGLSGIYIWGAQFEEGSVSDYDPTGPVAAPAATGLLFNRNLIQQFGTFSLVGNNSLLQRSVRIDATTRTYAVVGITTGLLQNRQLVSQTETFSIAGVDVTLQYIPVGVTLNLDTVVGAFSLSGTSISIDKQYYLNTSQAAYQLSGFDLQTTTNRSLQLTSATFNTRLQSNGDFFWYRTTQTIQPVKYRITKRNEWILGRATHMGRRGL